MRNFEEKIPA